MHAIYNFVSGPLLWAAFSVFIFGSLYRLIQMLQLVHRKERFIYSYISLKYSLRSILHWLTPFVPVNMRNNPIMTVVTFAFHICLIVTPIFLSAHVILWDESWNLSWWTLSDSAAGLMTLIVLGGCIFFLVRRRVLPEVKFLTSASDYVILCIVAAPFVTGYIAYHQWLDYRFFLICHIIAGEIMLVAIPFTRLSHMLFAPFTRAYMGSEFGKIRHAKDW